VSHDGQPGVRRVEFVMGMPILVDVRDDPADETAIDALFDWLRLVDATFSTYKEDSEISRLNRGELALADAGRDVRDVLARCDELREETGGYFDARFADGIVDPSGLVKGWSVDRAAAILEQHGLHNYAINAGGDIRLRGGARPDPVWRVGIQHPGVREGVAAIVAGDDLAVATSGEYARGQHVLDRNGRGSSNGVDGAAARLPGDDDPRRRARALDARIPARELKPWRQADAAPTTSRSHAPTASPTA